MLGFEDFLNDGFEMATNKAHCRPEVSKLILAFPFSKSVQDEIQDFGRESKAFRHSGLYDFGVVKAGGNFG